MSKVSKIPANLKTLLPVATNMAGSFDTDECLCVIEERLTGYEYDIAFNFLNWLNENGKTFGHNLESVFDEFIFATEGK